MNYHKLKSIFFVFLLLNILLAVGSVSAQATNTPPKSSNIYNITRSGLNSFSVQFTVSDKETNDSNINITTRSSDPNVIDSNGLKITGVGSNRTLSITPKAFGQSHITLVLDDGSSEKNLYNEYFILLFQNPNAAASDVINERKFDPEHEVITAYQHQYPNDQIKLILPRTSLSANELGLIINDADPQSVEVGEYYADKRKIPRGNLIHVNFPMPNLYENNGEAGMSVNDFLKLKSEVDAITPDHIQAYATTWYVPWHISRTSESNCHALSTALGLPPVIPHSSLFDKCESGETERGTAFVLWGRYMRTKNYHQYKDEFDIIPTMALTGENVALVKSYIDRSVAGDYTFPNGNIYLVKSNDDGRNGRFQDYISLVENWTRLGGVLSSYIDNSQKAVAYSSRLANVLFYHYDAMSVPLLGSHEFLPGSQGDAVSSYHGRLTYPKGQMSATRWLEAGVAATTGHTDEPANPLQFHSNVSQRLDYYFRGQTALEAYSKSIESLRYNMFMGDPLARPYGTMIESLDANIFTIKTTMLEPGRSYRLLGANVINGPYNIVKDNIVVDKQQFKSITVTRGYKIYKFEVDNQPPEVQLPPEIIFKPGETSTPIFSIEDFEGDNIKLVKDQHFQDLADKGFDISIQYFPDAGNVLQIAYAPPLDAPEAETPIELQIEEHHGRRSGFSTKAVVEGHVNILSPEKGATISSTAFSINLAFPENGFTGGAIKVLSENMGEIFSRSLVNYSWDVDNLVIEPVEKHDIVLPYNPGQITVKLTYSVSGKEYSKLQEYNVDMSRNKKPRITYPGPYSQISDSNMYFAWTPGDYECQKYKLHFTSNDGGPANIGATTNETKIFSKNVTSHTFYFGNFDNLDQLYLDFYCEHPSRNVGYQKIDSYQYELPRSAGVELVLPYPESMITNSFQNFQWNVFDRIKISGSGPTAVQTSVSVVKLTLMIETPSKQEPFFMQDVTMMDNISVSIPNNINSMTVTFYSELSDGTTKSRSYNFFVDIFGSSGSQMNNY